MNRDRFALLNEIRPRVDINDTWTADEQDAIKNRIVKDRSETRAPRRRRRVAVFAGAFVLSVVAVPGVAAAVGDGMKPQAFLEAYAYWSTDAPDGVDPATARRVATSPGPSTATFSVITASTRDGRTCLAPVIESSTSSIETLPSYFDDGGSFCYEAPNTTPFGPDTLTSTDTAAIWWAHAGDAVEAELRMPDGTTYPVIRVDGYLLGWYPLPVAGPDDAPTLTGYATDGSVIGRFKI